MTNKLNFRFFCRLSLLLFVGILSGSEPPEPFQRTALAGETGTFTLNLPLVFNQQNSPTTVFGAEMNPTNDEQGLEMMANAGTSWTRRNGVLWSAVEPVQGGGYNWSAIAGLENDLISAHEHGMKVILIIRGTPAWAVVPPFNYTCGKISSAALPDFGNFVQALVERYSVAPYYVKYFEIWNEPDVDPVYIGAGSSPWGCMGDIRDTAYYGGEYFATILQTVYPKVKAANSEAKVIVGGLLLYCNPNDPPLFDQENECTPSKYLEGILAAGGGSSFDGVSFHSYDYFSTGSANYQNGIYGNGLWNTGGAGDTVFGELRPVLAAKAQFLRSVLTSYGVGDKFLVNTETAILCGGAGDPQGGPGCEATPDSSFEKLKASYLAQSYATAIAEGLLANIWFTPTGWRNSGLLFSDLTPRPAYHAYILARNTLQDAAYVRDITEFTNNSMIGYEFLVGTRKVWVIWAADGKPHAITLPALPVGSWDELGNPVEFASGTLSIGELRTVYVDWGP